MLFYVMFTISPTPEAPMETNFRQQARDAVSRAKGELSSNSLERLKYAALELRMAMECLTYERASSYASELPPTEYETWQPRKLMLLLLEIDPRADKDSSVAYGVQDEPGKQSDAMTFLGKEKVLNLSMIKRHYDALGSYLHTPTLKQLKNEGAVDYDKLRARCELICTEVEATLASHVWNINFRRFSELSCMRCGHLVRKRINGPYEIARCFECNATYEINEVSPNQLSWKIIQQTVLCQATACGKEIVLLDADIEAGKSVTCPHCGAPHDIHLIIRLRDVHTCTEQ
jgi:DNA-directed RNA polymerase subunit RPC12/RpoP